MQQRSMMMFEAEHVTEESHWELSRDGASDAAAVLIELLREDSLRPRTFVEVVKRKMGLSGDTVPDGLARLFADQVDAVTMKRDRIKDIIEDTGEFQLRVTNADGQPAIRGGKPCAFALLQSDSGMADEQTQAQMTLSKVAALAKRRREAGKITDEQLDHAIDLTGEARRLLLNGDVADLAAQLPAEA
jgi:hypothetical protein